MNPEDFEKLVRDAEECANQQLVQSTDEPINGVFITPESKKNMNRTLRFIKVASFFIEICTILLVTIAIIAPFSIFPRTVMFVFATLGIGVFGLTVLLGFRARIKLLLQIETNTQRIALSKERIADALEGHRID